MIDRKFIYLHNIYTPFLILSLGVFLFSCEFGTEPNLSVLSEEGLMQNDSIITDNRIRVFEKLKLEYELSKSNSDFEKMATIGVQISEMFRNSYNNEKAIKYARLALESALLSNNKLLEIQAESILGKSFLSYYNQGDEKVPNEYIDRMVDSAEFHLQSSVKKSKLLLQKLGNRKEIDPFLLKIIASNYGNLSAIAFAKDDMVYAESYALESFKIFESNQDTIRLAVAYNNLGNVKLNQHQYKEAVRYYRNGVTLIDSLYDGSANHRKEKVNLLINLAWSLRKLEGAKENSYDIFYRAFEIETDLREEGITEMLAELEKKHNVENVRKEEAILKQREIDKANDFKIFSGLLLFLTIILAGTIFTLYRGSQLKQKNLELQLDKEQLLKSAELERLEKLSQTKVLNATMDGRESERKLIAEILHDSVSSLLSSANLHLQASRSVYNIETPEEIEKSQRIIEEASEKIRNLSHELISSVLLKFGLSYSIFDLCEKYSNSQLEIVHDVNNVRRYDQSFEIKINNIIEELVNNILKHSKATEAIISLEEREGQLFLEITDNGEGFDYRGEPNTSGLGLNQIKARVLMMKGKINIDSIPTQGTTINIVVPVVKKEVRKSELA